MGLGMPLVGVVGGKVVVVGSAAGAPVVAMVVAGFVTDEGGVSGSEVGMTVVVAGIDDVVVIRGAWGVDGIPSA